MRKYGHVKRRNSEHCSHPRYGRRSARGAVEYGDYDSVSEVVGDALRDWRNRRRVETLETEDVRRLVQEGIDSGPRLEADAVFARLRARFGQPPGA